MDNKKQKNNKKWLSIVIVSIIIIVIAIAVGIGIFISGQKDSDYDRDSRNESQPNYFITTNKNKEKAIKWIKDKTYKSLYEPSVNRFNISFYNSKNIYNKEDISIGLDMNFDTKDTNNTDLPCKLVNPQYFLRVLTKTHSDYPITNAIIKIGKDNTFKFELKEMKYGVRRLNVLQSDISVSRLNTIKNSNKWSLTLYDGSGDEFISTDSTELLDSFKKQIKAGEVFYSLKNTTWNFD